MKKSNLLCIYLFGFIIISCSTESITEENSSVEIFKYENSLFYENNLSVREVVFYEEGKRKIDSVYGSIGDLRGYKKYFYNSKSLLNSIKFYDHLNSIYLEIDLTYDTENKLIKKHTNYISSTIQETTYEYPTNDSIISTTHENGSLWTKNTYIVNEFGLINKEISQYNSVFVTVEYDGQNPVKKIMYDGRVTIIKYDNINIPSDFLLNSLKSLFGENYANPILFSDTLNFESPLNIDKYITSIERESDENSIYSYVFSNDNRLMKTTINTGNTKIENKYFYR